MSSIETIVISEPLLGKLRDISSKLDKLNTGNVRDAYWLAKGRGGGGYDWSETNLGLTIDGRLVEDTQSGCSCNGPEEPTIDASYPLVTDITLKMGYDGELEDAVKNLAQTTEVLYRVFNDEEVSAEGIIGLDNAEIRRSVIEYIGMDKFLKLAKPTILDENTEHGILMTINLPGDEDMVLLKVKDASTDREYFLRVPPRIKKAAQARAWTFGLKAEEFKPLIET